LSGEEHDDHHIQDFKLNKKKVLSEKWLIGKMSPIKIKWDLFIIVLAIYNCFFLPLELSLLPDITRYYPWIESMNIVIDFFFFVDIIACFRTTEFNSTNGMEIHDTKQLAIMYIKGRFFLDLMSSVPFEKIA
jgi:hypothetical protein